jgi:HAD superfamily phosphoserine phosphatase-like hydrolase
VTDPPAPACEAVLFDMDGVLFEGHNFWLDLHRAYGTETEGVEAADRLLAVDYDALALRVVGELWRGRPAATYHRLVAERRYQPGVEELFGFLHAEGMRTAIVSSGPALLAARAQRELGIDVVRANALAEHDGMLTGAASIAVPDADKAPVGLEVIARWGLDPAAVAMVGDGGSDAALAELVGLPVAYDTTSERLLAVADVVLQHGELGRLREHLARR